MVTPQQSYPPLAAAFDLTNEVYLKREDLHPYGSHKGRSIPHMIEMYAAQGIRDFVISSSGNAALAATLSVREYNEKHSSAPLSLAIFVGPHIDETKLKNMLPLVGGGRRGSQRDLCGVSIHQVANPKQQAFQLDKIGGTKNLRQSTDDLALAGYRELAEELAEIHDLQAIFIPTSSGTTAQALGEAFAEMGKKIQIHIVQTAACHPMVDFGNQTSDFSDVQPPIRSQKSEVRSPLASAIVDRIAHRKQKIIEIIKKSAGSGWIVSDDEITEAIALLKQTCGITISPNSALSVAGLKKAADSGWRWTGALVCLVTGA